MRPFFVRNSMKVQILKGVFIKGNAVFPTTGEGKNAKETIVDVSVADAKALIDAGQAVAADKSAKVTVKIEEKDSEDAKLDAFFGEE